MAACALITGATGFAGSHLVEHLLQFESNVAAWWNPRGQRPTSADPRVAWRAIDLLDRQAVASAIAELRPSAIYHCGGMADVGESWEQPEKALSINVLGTYHVLEGVRRAHVTCPVLVTGSALVYRHSRSAISEDSPIGPSTPYGVSKLAQEMLAAHAPGCAVIVARPFNHAGPRQSPAYVSSSIARQIAEIEAGLRAPVVRVGNLNSQRDITDVRDTVGAYRRLVLRGQPNRPYNVCSGRAYRIRDLLDTLVAQSRMPVTVDVDPMRLRPSDNPLILGDPSRIAAETGWRAEIPIERTLTDLLDYWRARVAADRP